MKNYVDAIVMSDKTLKIKIVLIFTKNIDSKNVAARSS